ncbi:MAG: glycosyltransferase family 4 protein [Candidatus Omnitrophica bacterium]|nr:glycosyltransferase family 4 protein [Candidatus Omnitrophota bacterium]
MSKKKIGIDARMIRHSGIGSYLSNLIPELPNHRPFSYELHFFGPPSQLSQYGGFARVRAFGAPIYGWREQAGAWLRARSMDLWHAPHFNIPFFCPTRLVVTIHDLIPLIFAGRFFDRRKLFYFMIALNRAAQAASKIISVSENTKQDLIRYFNVRPEKIRVIQEAVHESFRPVTDSRALEDFRRRRGLDPRDSFILYVGLLKPHKNLPLLLSAVRRLRKSGKIAEKLLVVGKKDKKYGPEHAALAELRSDGDVIYWESAAAEELPLLYSLARMYVQPSLYEGFGLTVLEAMACGAPVIASRAASLPEVAGDAAVLFDPASEEDLSQAIERLAADRALRNQLAAKGRERAARFSWRRTAGETMQVYQEALA